MPLSTSSAVSAFTASFTGASMFSVRSRMVKEASPSSVVAPDLMPFLPFACTFSVPAPQSTTCEPSLHLMTAFSASALPDSSLLLSVSVSVFSVPAATSMVTSLPLPQTMGAVVSEVSVNPFSTSVTPSVPFSTVTLPSAQLP